MRRQDLAEEIVKKFLEEEFNTAVVDCRQPENQGLHDFEIKLTDDTKIAIEVTSTVFEEVMAKNHATTKELPFTGNYYWDVKVLYGKGLTVDAAELGGFLKKLESKNIASWSRLNTSDVDAPKFVVEAMCNQSIKPKVFIYYQQSPLGASCVDFIRILV